MKLAKFSLLFICAILFANCEKADPTNEIPKEQEEPKKEKPKEPETVTYLKFNSNPDQNTENTDDYIVVHDQNGKLLGHRSFEKGDNLVFQTMDTSLVEATSLTMTVLQILKYQQITTHEIQSYTEIGIGTELLPAVADQVYSIAPNDPINTFNNINSKANNQASKNEGTFDLKVTNTNGVARYAISTQIYRPAFIDHIPQDIDSLVLNDVQLRKNTEYLISLEDFDGNYRYAFFDVPDTDGKLEFDFNNFLEFDNILEVAMPTHQRSSGNSIGYRSAENIDILGFDMSFHAEQGQEEMVRFGYIDSLEFYHSHLFVGINPSFHFSHSERGFEVPTKMQLLDQPSFTISNNVLNNFQFETDASYLRSIGLWRYWNNNANGLSIGTSWRVHTASGKQAIIGQLPEEIIENYPEINLDKLALEQTELMTLGDNYEDYIKKSFGLAPLTKSYIIQKIILIE